MEWDQKDAFITFHVTPEKEFFRVVSREDPLMQESLRQIFGPPPAWRVEESRENPVLDREIIEARWVSREAAAKWFLRHPWLPQPLELGPTIAALDLTYRTMSTAADPAASHGSLPKSANVPCSDGIESPAPVNEERNKFCYEKRKKGTKLAAILREVNATAGWSHLGSAQSVTDAADAYARKNRLPVLRKHKRKRIQENSDSGDLKTPE
jgi:hypothetical protein